MSPITASQIEEAAGLKEKKPRKVKASEIERVAGFESPASFPTPSIEKSAPASTTKAQPFASEPSKIQRFVKTAAEKLAEFPDIGREAFPGAFPENAFGTAQATIAALGVAPVRYAEAGLTGFVKGARESKNPLVTAANVVRAVLPGLSSALEGAVSGEAYESPEKAAETVVGALFDFPIVAGLRGALKPKGVELPDVPFVEKLADEIAPEARAKTTEFVRQELDAIDKMTRLQASEELFNLAKERGLDEKQAGQAIAGLSEQQVKEHLRRNSTQRVAERVLFPETASRPKTIEIPPEGKVTEEVKPDISPETIRQTADQIVAGEQSTITPEVKPALELELRTRAERGEAIVPPRPASELSLDDYIAQETGNALRQPSSGLFKKTFEPGREIRIRPKRLEDLKEEHRRMTEDAIVLGESAPGAESYGDLKVELMAERRILEERRGKGRAEADRQIVEKPVESSAEEITKFAESQGIEYQGQFEGFTKKSGEVVPPQHTFLDPQTGGNFNVGDISEVPAELAKLRESFGHKRAEPVAPEVVDVEAIAREVEAARPKPGINPGPEPTAQPLPIEQIRTDVDRFQNRMSEVAPETVQAIVENFDPNKFDPIVVWKDPVDGQTYVLSGHSRLAGMKARGETAIPSRFFQGTAEEAARFATIEANRLATKESLPETITAFRKAKTEGLSQSKMRDLFGSDVQWLDAVQNLDPKGQFLDLLGQPPSALESFPYIKRTARWVGELRGLYADKLTSFHEQQLFDFLYKSERRNLDIGRENFFHLVQKQLDTFDWTPDRPLTLKRTGELLSGTKARADTAPAEAEIERLRALQEETRTVEEHQALQREIDRIRQSISEMVQNQSSLFDPAPKVAPGFGESNSIFTKDKLDAAMKDLGDPTKLRTGLDPKLLKNLIDIGGYYLEGGIREVGEWSKKVLESIPPTYREIVKPHLEALYADLTKIADSREAALNRVKNEAEITMGNVKEAIDQLGEAERLALREFDHLQETGHFPTEAQAEFRELTPFPEEVIRKTLVSPEIVAAKSAHFAERLEATANLIDELGLDPEAISDILEKNVYSASATALRKLVAELKESSGEFAKVGRSASYSLLERKKAIERLQALAYKLGPIKDQIAGIKWVKTKEPALNHFYKLLTDAKFRRETTGSETLERLARGWTSNLFRLFSFIFDFVGNSTVQIQQGLTGVAKDVGRIVQEGTYDYFGRPYGLEEIGTPQWSYTREFFNSWKKAKLLDPQRNILALPPEVRIHLGWTLFGEKMGQRQPRLFLESEKFPRLAKYVDYSMAGPAYAKMHIDQLSKSVAAEAELSALADIAAGKLGFKHGTAQYEEFTTLWRQKLPTDVVQEVVRRAQEASFSVEFQSRFAQEAGRILSHPISKLIIHPFLFWKMQFTRWMLQSLAPLKATRAIWRDSRTMPTQAAVYKNLPDLFSDVTKAATGWGGLWLLKNMFLDDENPDSPKMDFTRMRVVWPDGSYVNIGSLEPLSSGLLLVRLMQWTDEDDPKKREQYKKDFEAGFKYSSILGLGAQGQEGLAAGLLPMALNLAGTENYGYRAKRDFDRFLITLLPGNALLTSLNSLMEREKREGVLGKLPFVSRFAPYDIDPTTGEPKIQTMQFPPGERSFRLFGFRSRTLEGAPLPASRIIPNEVQAILEYAGEPLYPSWTLASVAGYGALSDVPDDVRRDWLIELGQARREIFGAYGWTLDDIREMDVEKAKDLVRNIDNRAALVAQKRLNIKYGTPSRDVGEFYLRGPRIERRRMKPEEAR